MCVYCSFHWIGWWLKTKYKTPTFFAIFSIQRDKKSGQFWWIETTTKNIGWHLVYSNLVFSHQAIHWEEYKIWKMRKLSAFFKSTFLKISALMYVLASITPLFAFNMSDQTFSREWWGPLQILHGFPNICYLITLQQKICSANIFFVPFFSRFSSLI